LCGSFRERLFACRQRFPSQLQRFPLPSAFFSAFSPNQFLMFLCRRPLFRFLTFLLETPLCFLFFFPPFFCLPISRRQRRFFRLYFLFSGPASSRLFPFFSRRLSSTFFLSPTSPSFCRNPYEMLLCASPFYLRGVLQADPPFRRESLPSVDPLLPSFPVRYVSHLSARASVLVWLSNVEERILPPPSCLIFVSLRQPPLICFSLLF